MLRRRLPHLLPLLLLVTLCGCGRLKHQEEAQTVYVLQKQTFLRDRVAAVSNRVAIVQNGQRLQLLERGRRFLKVKTEKGEIGWIEEHAVVDPAVVDGFAELQKAHVHDPVVATAVLRDDGYLHLKPGRDTERYYLLPEGDKLQLLVRASVPKAIGPQASSASSSYARVAKKPKTPAFPSAKPKSDAKPGPDVKPGSDAKPGNVAASAAPANPAQPAATLPNGDPIPMEDWWMVRDSQGRVGWLMSRRMDVDVPDEIAGYAEGQRIVGAYLLQKLSDPESTFPDKMAPEYVTVTNPYQDGLPYDFSQVRVFTWNLKKHRYETAFRQRNLQGYLPVAVAMKTLDKQGPVPTFQFKQSVGDSVTVDPATGAVKPAQAETLTYRLDGAIVRKVEPQAQPGPTPAAKPVARADGGRRRTAHRHHHHR